MLTHSTCTLGSDLTLSLKSLVSLWHTGVSSDGIVAMIRVLPDEFASVTSERSAACSVKSGAVLPGPSFGPARSTGFPLSVTAPFRMSAIVLFPSLMLSDNNTLTRAEKRGQAPRRRLDLRRAAGAARRQSPFSSRDKREVSEDRGRVARDRSRHVRFDLRLRRSGRRSRSRRDRGRP